MSNWLKNFHNWFAMTMSICFISDESSWELVDNRLKYGMDVVYTGSGTYVNPINLLMSDYSYLALPELALIVGNWVCLCSRCTDSSLSGLAHMHTIIMCMHLPTTCTLACSGTYRWIMCMFLQVLLKLVSVANLQLVRHNGWSFVVIHTCFWTRLAYLNPLTAALCTGI